MRAALVFGLLTALALVLGAPSKSLAATCSETECGVPQCWEPTVRIRPDTTRAVAVRCRGAISARLVTPPAHSEVSNVWVDPSRLELHFDARPDEDSPRFDEAVFEITGHEGSIEQRVGIEVVPTSENSPPVCDGDQATVRSDGTGPVAVYLHPFCRDPDGDDFVIRGGPPGVHSQSPKSVPAGDNDSNWPYRTATFSGEETTTIWATDSLGARSEDAQLVVTVGPGIDRPPECRPANGDGYSVLSRPGAIRRFPIACTDPDGDLFVSRLSSPPERGVLAAFDLGEPSYGFWGVTRWIDATYVPTDSSSEPDPFSVTATGVKGDGPAGQMAVVQRPLPENTGGGCGWSPLEVTGSVPGLGRITCDDNEGDPLSAEVVTEPRHGTAGPAVVTPVRYGASGIAIPYVANVGYEGYDCVKVKVTDGYGTAFDITIDITVRPAAPVEVDPGGPPDPPSPPVPPDPPVVEDPPPPPAPPDPPVVEDPPSPPAPPDPPVVEDPPSPPVPPDHAPPPVQQPDPPPVQQADPPAVQQPDPPPASSPPPPPVQWMPPVPLPQVEPGATSAETRDVVEGILGTTAVRRLRGTGSTQVWARSNLSRRDLVRYGRAPGLVVLCSSRCQIRADSKLATGLRSVRASRGKTALAAVSGQPQVLSLAIRPAERRALRRARKAKAQFAITIRSGGGRARSVKRSIAVSR
ncbi:MAG: hypothetical protein QOH76_312 [Thermoleophilaceae bacterium]|nr:hypothetical protein [Thermoleophilaceae bacterium]